MCVCACVCVDESYIKSNRDKKKKGNKTISSSVPEVPAAPSPQQISHVCVYVCVCVYGVFVRVCVCM